MPFSFKINVGSCYAVLNECSLFGEHHQQQRHGIKAKSLQAAGGRVL